jgi:hypothetical protein
MSYSRMVEFVSFSDYIVKKKTNVTKQNIAECERRFNTNVPNAIHMNDIVKQLYVRRSLECVLK